MCSLCLTKLCNVLCMWSADYNFKMKQQYNLIYKLRKYNNCRRHSSVVEKLPSICTSQIINIKERKKVGKQGREEEGRKEGGRNRGSVGGEIGATNISCFKIEISLLCKTFIVKEKRLKNNNKTLSSKRQSSAHSECRM